MNIEIERYAFIKNVWRTSIFTTIKWKKLMFLNNIFEITIMLSRDTIDDDDTLHKYVLKRMVGKEDAYMSIILSGHIQCSQLLGTRA